MATRTTSTIPPTQHDDPRAEQRRRAEVHAVIRRAGEAAVAAAALPEFDPFDKYNPEDYSAYLARVAAVRGAGEAEAIRWLRAGASVEQLGAELDRAATTRTAAPAVLVDQRPSSAVFGATPAPAVPVVNSAIVHAAPTPSPVAGSAALGKGSGWQHSGHDHSHNGAMIHGAEGDHSHQHTHLDGTSHSHPHQHGHDHQDHHEDDEWRLAGGASDIRAGSGGHSHSHVHVHDHSHTYRTGEPIDTALARAEMLRGKLVSSGKQSVTGASINAGYSDAAMKTPPVGSAAQMAAAGKTQSLAETVVPSVVAHRDLMNTEDAAALDFGMPEPADEASETPDDSIQLDETTLHEGGHQPQASLGQSDLQIPRASDIGALITLFKTGVLTRGQVRQYLGLEGSAPARTHQARAAATPTSTPSARRDPLMPELVRRPARTGLARPAVAPR